jgi:NarL family two-component system response regulator LiaR
MIRVLIVDDHIVVRKGLQALLASEKYGVEVIGEAGDGNQAVELASKLQPEVILMDLHMPHKSGLDAIREIKQEGLSARILVLSSFGEDERVAAAMRAGASGYLLKDSSPDELVSAIKAVALGHIALPEELSQSLFSTQIPADVSINEDHSADLTGREVDILRCLAQGDSNKEIAIKLSIISLTTVRTHVSNILRKLGLKNRTQAAIYAREQELDK